MSNLDLSLTGILDDRWSLKEIGKGKIKLDYNSLRGIPSSEETKRAIKVVLEAKGIDSVYVSGDKGDIEITASQIANSNFSLKSVEPSKNIRCEAYDVLAQPFGAEEDLFWKEGKII